MSLRSFVVILVAVAMLAGGPVLAVASVGQVDAIVGPRGDGDVVLRRGPRTLPVRDYMLLYPNDAIVVRRAGITVRLLLAGESRPRKITAANSPFRVPANASTRPPTGPASLMASFDYLFDSRPASVPVYTQSRTLAADPALAAHPLLPAGAQLITRDQRTVSPVWMGGSSDVLVRNDRGVRRMGNATRNWAVIERPPGDRFSLSLANAPLGWEVQVVDAASVPRTVWQEPGEPPSGGLRIVRAVCLLKEGSPQWALFAISELEDLSRSDLGAARLWHAVRAGELGEEWKTAHADQSCLVVEPRGQ